MIRLTAHTPSSSVSTMKSSVRKTGWRVRSSRRMPVPQLEAAADGWHCRLPTALERTNCAPNRRTAMPSEAFVIVGASLAGASAAATLRKQGFEGRVVLIGEEHERPYERPPLSKDFLRGESKRDAVFVHGPNYYAEKDIDLRTGVRVSSDRACDSPCRHGRWRATALRKAPPRHRVQPATAQDSRRRPGRHPLPPDRRRLGVHPGGRDEGRPHPRHRRRVDRGRSRGQHPPDGTVGRDGRTQLCPARARPRPRSRARLSRPAPRSTASTCT